VFDAYLAAGGNFIDTANIYTGGTSERMLSRMIAAERARLVLATKYSMTTDPKDPNAGGNSRKNLQQSLDASLRRLGTDYVDLYWVHAWDGMTPVDELLRALDDAVRAGKVRALAVTSPRRHPSFPELATMSEAGVPGFQSEAWYGLIGPARLPAPVVSRIHEQAVAALSGADVRQRLQAQGAEVVASSPAAFAAFIRDELARYAPVVKAAGIVAQ
jgi:aryl-alcohol dehydrogenase-like predicted oxidoreductase